MRCCTRVLPLRTVNERLNKETRVAKARREERVPTLEQVRHVIHMMPASTEIERRDQALIAFTILTGARDRATASLKLKHIDVHQGRVNQDARQVNTKFSKTFTTWFFPVGEDLVQIIVNWVNYLLQERLWGGDDPLFRRRRSWSELAAISKCRVSIAKRRGVRLQRALTAP
jgi:site-specific recombinase XerC